MFALRRTITPLVQGGCRLKHTLPDLPYDYAALEPVISRDIMALHHGKHHATYVNNLNTLQDQLAEAISKEDVSKAISLQQGVKFNGGGHINHTIFWQNLTPSATNPSQELCSQIDKDFGSFEKMKTQLSAAAVGVQGSGWAWLGLSPADKSLKIAACANQDPLQATTGLIPLLGIDVWEHAYYLQYKNVRPDYVKSLFQVVNWNDVSARYQQGLCN